MVDLKLVRAMAFAPPVIVAYLHESRKQYAARKRSVASSVDESEGVGRVGEYYSIHDASSSKNNTGIKNVPMPVRAM